MILREETFEQAHGAGILELRGGDLEVALFVNGKPLVYDGDECSGSVLRFTVLLPDPPQLPDIRAIELSAQNGFEEKVPLREQIAPLLKLLPNGYYRLALTETEGMWAVDWEGIEKVGTPLGYYPLGDNYERVKWLVPTQLDNRLSDERTNFYISEIERGAHPALIVVGSKFHDAWFVLDGHHKLMASWCCGVRPRALLIEFQALPPISAVEARNILREATGGQFRSYLNFKGRRWWNGIL